MTALTTFPEWLDLKHHYDAIHEQHMRDWFAQDENRFDTLSLSACELFLDYSRNRIQPETIPLLCRLATRCQLSQKIADLFSGQPVNTTEKRAVLHSALRSPADAPVWVDGNNIKPEIAAMRHKMKSMVQDIQQQKWLGATGKPIKYVINIGIGGSHLGPKMCVQALKEYGCTDLQFHFVASVDQDVLNDVLEQIEPESSLFIISSKTFTTIETLTNAKTVLRWLQNAVGHHVLEHHFIAVTASDEKAREFGIPHQHILPLWDWVGGRYSVWSAIGLPLMLMLGCEQFEEFLSGAYQMDQHFQTADFAHNMPVILGLLGIWYRNFFHTSVQAIIPYSHRLRYLIAYLQQADMESNGKSTSLADTDITYGTGGVVFGEEGCNGQHAYHQLLLQGSHLIPVDFILVKKDHSAEDPIHHEVLLASGLSQAQALMYGKNYHESLQELKAKGMSEPEAAKLAHHKIIPGNRPSNILIMKGLNPRNLGALLALYEHRIFVQGVIWNINSFDQWGVELGKQLLPNILSVLRESPAAPKLDAATIGLIKQLKGAS